MIVLELTKASTDDDSDFSDQRATNKFLKVFFSIQFNVNESFCGETQYDFEGSNGTDEKPSGNMGDDRRVLIAFEKERESSFKRTYSPEGRSDGADYSVSCASYSPDRKPSFSVKHEQSISVYTKNHR